MSVDDTIRRETTIGPGYILRGNFDFPYEVIGLKCSNEIIFKCIYSTLERHQFNINGQ